MSCILIAICNNYYANKYKIVFANVQVTNIANEI